MTAGYEVKSSVSKGLTYLVTNDINSGSTKAKKALSYGTKIINEEEFLKLVSKKENNEVFEL
jgi:DNA ligase (NAD+)